MALRGVLRLAECFYAAAVRWRNRRYDRGAAAVHRVGVPVVSVGNLTLGGTGKTPLVEWLAEWFHSARRSRGGGQPRIWRGSRRGERRGPRVATAVARRAARAKSRPRGGGARGHPRVRLRKLIVLDDGFQHRRIARDLDIVLLDALEPFGFGHVFPRGTLREPVEGLRRADVGGSLPRRSARSGRACRRFGEPSASTLRRRSAPKRSTPRGR